MIVDQIRAVAIPGTVIPKPEAQADFIVKGRGKRRGKEALIYLVPNHKNPAHPRPKGVNTLEWEQAYKHLMSVGNFSRVWFEQNMAACAEEGGCNFTTIGGLFQLLDLVDYERGLYILRRHQDL